MSRFATPLGRAPRRLAFAALVLAGGAFSGANAAPACIAGDEACPVALKMAPGANAIVATGSVSGERPDYYFKFAARAGQKLTIHIVGGDIKTGPGIPITFPNGSGDAVDVDAPYALPATGDYVIFIHANTMSEGPFGRFRLTLRIE
ncbi:MAG: hypothetical protein ABSC22_20265 [Roseiarcus sp.]